MSADDKKSIQNYPLDKELNIIWTRECRGSVVDNEGLPVRASLEALIIIFLPIILGAQKKHFETILLNTHNMFWLRSNFLLSILFRRPA